MSSIISHIIKKRETPMDIFYTPASLVKIHLEEVKPFLNGGIILDPFKGKGAYYDMYKEHFSNCSFDWCEIEEGKDFFDYDTPIDAIISNPPYSMIDKVLEHSVRLNPKVISYLVGYGNLTAKRMEYMNKNSYELCCFHLTKVFKWYGMSAIITFRKVEGVCNNVVKFDRQVHR
jgi:hypothetical protein